MQKGSRKSLVVVASAIALSACGNRTDLLEPPWGVEDAATQDGAGGSAGLSGKGGASGAVGKGGSGGAPGKGGASGQGGTGGGPPTDICVFFCSQCSGTVKDCLPQCMTSQAQFGAQCKPYFEAVLLCGVGQKCDPNVCKAELNALVGCMSTGMDGGY